MRGKDFGVTLNYYKSSMKVIIAGTGYVRLLPCFEFRQSAQSFLLVIHEYSLIFMISYLETAGSALMLWFG